MREMKECGIQWIPEIPSNWKVLRGKSILRLLKRSPDSFTEVITCFRDGEVTLRKNRREEGFTFSDKEIGYQGICNGDLVIHGMDGFAGAIGISDSDGKGSPVLVVCDSNENKKYLVYYLRMLATQNVFVAIATGIRERSCDLRWNKIADLLFPIPPVSEQNKIVDYLDEKCAKIDAVIEKQKQVIEKLKEYKLSVITEAVTKGLDPTVPMKDSGVEWIGEIPEEWQVAKLSNLFDFLGGYAFNSDLYTSESNNLVVRIGNVKSDKLLIDANPVYISDELARQVGKFKLKSQDIVFTMTGTKGKRDYFYTKLLDESDISKKDLYLNQRVGCFRAKENIYAKYYCYLLKEPRILDSVFLYETGTANQGNLGIDSIGRTRVHMPSYEEQIEIAEYLHQKCSEIDSAILKKQAIVEKLTEYKKSLIYEVVTGKREV